MIHMKNNEKKMNNLRICALNTVSTVIRNNMT